MYHGVQYCDAALGRFIVPDTIVPEPGNPQALNRPHHPPPRPKRPHSRLPVRRPCVHTLFGATLRRGATPMPGARGRAPPPQPCPHGLL
jgi:hypothetical protein